MRVSDLIAWLKEVPQDEEVKWDSRLRGTICLLVHDPDDPHDDYESDIIDSK